MKGGRAARNCAGVRSIDKGRKLSLKGGDLRTLRDPAGKNRAARCGYFLLAKMRARHWNKIFRHESDVP